jgi:hypothetical protein
VFGAAIVMISGIVLFGLGRGGTGFVVLLLVIATIRVIAAARRRRVVFEAERLRVAAAPRPCVTVRRLGAGQVISDR